MPRKLQGSSGDPQRDVASRMKLAQSCEQLILKEYREAVGRGVRDPVVFLLDCRDELGYEAAKFWGASEEEIETRILAQEGGSVPGATVVLAHAVASSEVRKSRFRQTLPKTLDQPLPPGQVAIVVVSMHGVSGICLEIGPS